MKLIFLINVIIGYLVLYGETKNSNVCGIPRFQNGSDCESVDTTRNVLKENSINLYKSIVYLYDHFYWNISALEKVVSKACGLDMAKYLYALSENKPWATRGKLN